MTKIKYIVIGVLLLFSISLVVTGCGATSTTSASGYLSVDEKIGPELSNQELVAEVGPAVVSIVRDSKL